MREWGLDLDDMDALLTQNPSLRSFVSGYCAEMKCGRIWFHNHPDISDLHKPDDHDRTASGDIAFTYRNQPFTVEVKSLQTGSVKVRPDGTQTGTAQCDASDRRAITFPDGTVAETTCLLVGGFDILAVNTFAFDGQWRFLFAKNADLPRVSANAKGQGALTPAQRGLLLSTSIPIVSGPPKFPFRDEPWSLMDEIVASRKSVSHDSIPRVALTPADEQLTLGF